MSVEELRRYGVTGDWMTVATRCSYCGCVYTGSGASKAIRGWLNGVDSGWFPKS